MRLEGSTSFLKKRSKTLLILAVVCTTGTQSQAKCELGAVAVLPLQFEHGHYLVTVDINHRAARLILDTGAFATSLTLRAAQRLGVPMSQVGIESVGIGGNRHTYGGTAAQMQVGYMNANGMRLAGANFATGNGTDAPDGLFGMNMMAAYDIDLDIPGQHAILFSADGACRQPTVGGIAPPLYAVKLNYVTNDREANIDVTIEGRRLRAIVDSGAAQTVMFRSTARRLGVDIAGFTAPGHHASSGIGPDRVASFTQVFANVDIGNLHIANMPIEVLDQENNGANHEHTGSLLPDPSGGGTGYADLLLGADFMQKVHLWISHSSQKLIMQYPPAASVLPK